MLTESEVGCPYCNESISLLIDLSVEGQAYIEDCSVCCQPILVRYASESGTLSWVSVEQS